MSKTLIGLFDTEDHAVHAAGELSRRGVSRERIAVVPVVAAELDEIGEKQRATRARRATLGAGIGMLAGALIAILALPVGIGRALLAALVGAAVGIALGITTREHQPARGSAFVAVRTADSKLARIAKHVFSREAIDYAFEGTTVARTRLRARRQASAT
jgi:uncharacterized membrane protein